MPQTVTVIGPANAPPVTLAEAKAHLRVLHTDEDSYISALISVASQHAANHTNRTLIESDLRLTLDDVPASGVVELPRGPVQSVSSIEFVGTSGEWVEATVGDFRIDFDSRPARIVPKPDKAWPDFTPGPGMLRINYTAGAASADDVPMTIKQAILILIAHFYEHREPVVTGTIVSTVPESASALLDLETHLELG